MTKSDASMIEEKALQVVKDSLFAQKILSHKMRGCLTAAVELCRNVRFYSEDKRLLAFADAAAETLRMAEPTDEERAAFHELSNNEARKALGL